MGKIILVTGGARSGKSSFAEDTAKKFGDDVLYIATSIPLDDEMKSRIKKHRDKRPANWETLEVYKDMDRHLAGKLEGKSAVLLDCITIMITNIMLEVDRQWDRLKTEEIEQVECLVAAEVNKLINVADMANIPFIIVTNEIGMGIVPDNPLSRIFRDIAGRVNQRIANAAQEVFFCVSGIPIKIK